VQQGVARLSAVWTGSSGWGRVERQGGTGGEGLGTTGSEKLKGDDCKRHFTARRGEIHRCDARLAYAPMLAGASSNANISWRQRAGVMGGGTDASLR
jgi:hypothetical protein